MERLRCCFWAKLRGNESMSRRVIGAFVVGLGFSSGAIAQISLQSVLFDESSRNYVLEDEGSPGTVSIVFPDGSIDHPDPRLTPFDFHRSKAVTGFPAIPVGLELDNRSGILLDGQGFYRLASDGRHAISNLYADGILPCEKLDPRDQCFAEFGLKGLGFSLLSYYHSKLGPRWAVSHGNGYAPVSDGLAGLIDDDRFDLFVGRFRIFPFGPDGSYVITKPYFYDANDEFEWLKPGGREAIELPWTTGAYIRIVSKKVGEDIIAIGKASWGEPRRSVGLDRATQAFRIRSAGLRADILTIDLSQVPVDRWLGIDGGGVAYGQSKDGAVLAVDTTSREWSRLDLTCLGTAEVTRIARHEDDAVWLTCGNRLVGLARHGIAFDQELPGRISRAYLVSTTSEPLTALFLLNGATWLRADGAELHTVDLKKLTDGGRYSNPVWADGDRICRSSGIASYQVECFAGDEWHEVATYPIPSPSAIIHANGATWALAGNRDETKLYRQKAGRGSAWETIADVPSKSRYAQSRFIPSARGEGFVIFVPTVGVFRYSPGGIEKLPIDANDLAEAIAAGETADGWFYLVKETKSRDQKPRPRTRGRRLASHVLYELWAYDSQGSKKLLDENLPEAGFRLIPLQRGVLLSDSGSFSKLAARMIYRDRLIELSALFGELKAGGGNAAISYWLGQDGWGYIKKSTFRQIGTVPATRDRIFRTNGSRLESLSDLESLRSFADLSSEGAPSQLTNPEQIWQNPDGLWFRTADRYDSVALHMDDSLVKLLTASEGVNLNQIAAAARLDHEVVLANNLGLWFCPSENAPVVSADDYRIRRHQGCRLNPLLGVPRQIEHLKGDKFLVLSGHELVSLAGDSRQVMASSVQSERMAISSEQVWFATGDKLASVNFAGETTTKPLSLPDGIGGSDVRVGDSTYLCTKKGLFSRNHLKSLNSIRTEQADSGRTEQVGSGRTEQVGSGRTEQVGSGGTEQVGSEQAGSGWTELASSCLAGGGDVDGFVAVTEHGLVRCQGGGCTPAAALPYPEISEVVLGRSAEDGAILISQAREVYRLEQGSLEKCPIRWGFGALPKAPVVAVDAGLVVSAGGGVYDLRCDGGQIPVYRLY